MVVAGCVLAVEGAARGDVVVTKVGDPTFDVADAHLFSAPIGTAADGYEGFATTQQTLLPPPNHVVNPILGIGPGAPHAGPYDHEFADGIAAAGYQEGDVFDVSQYSNGMGVYLVFMLTPGPDSPVGSSPDFASGPILPNSIFPLDLSGATYTDGVLNDPFGDLSVPAIDQVPGFEGLDGHSHIPFFFADSFDFASNPVTGDYEYRLSIRDANGNGYDVVASFQVVPEPSAWVMMSLGGLALASLARRRPARARR
jgi:hypothetical protein